MEENKPKKTKIKNKNYKEFLEKGIIRTINREQIDTVINQIEHKHATQYKHYILLLYLTGARPKELLLLTAKDFEQESKYVKVRIPALKRGVTRTIYLPLADTGVKKMYEWIKNHYPELVIFWGLISDKKRVIIVKKKVQGVEKTYERTYHDMTNKLYHWFKKFFAVIDHNDSFTPYFLRHNRFSKLSEDDVSMQDIMILKGGKSMESVRPYIHMSSARAKKLSKKLTQ
jgi:integrase